MRNIKLLLLAVFIPVFMLCSVNAKGQFTKLFDFNQANGAHPVGSLISDGTFFYGMTWSGGQDSLGNIFKIKPDGSGFVDLFDFNGTNGAHPDGSLILYDSFLYGVTSYSGGTIFKIKPDGTNFSTLFNFNGTNGAGPFGPLLLDSTFLYGTTSEGGIYGRGVIFRIKIDGTGFADLLNFNDTISGKFPSGSLIKEGSYLYGFTNYGVSSYGSIFKIKPDGTDFTELFDFTGTNNGFPSGHLISDSTFFYGVTHGEGQINHPGDVFKIKKDGTGFISLFDFTYAFVNDSTTASYGGYPQSALIMDSTYLYGMTYMGGASNKGVVFKIKKDGTGFADMLDFNYTTGAYPIGSLISDGTYLYGMTQDGGANNLGTIFKLGLSATGIQQYSKVSNIPDLLIYPNPTNGKLWISLPKGTNFNNAVIDLFDYQGKLLKTKILAANERKIAVDMQDYSTGIYFIKINTAEKQYTAKVILTH